MAENERNPVYLLMREWVRSKGTEQRGLAQKMGISEGRLSLMLNGKRKITVDDYLCFCEAADMDPREAFPDEQRDAERLRLRTMGVYTEQAASLKRLEARIRALKAIEETWDEFEFIAAASEVIARIAIRKHKQTGGILGSEFILQQFMKVYSKRIEGLPKDTGWRAPYEGETKIIM